MSHKHAPRDVPLTQLGPWRHTEEEEKTVYRTWRQRYEEGVSHIDACRRVGAALERCSSGSDDISNVLDGQKPNPRTFANIGRENERHLAPSTAERKMEVDRALFEPITQSQKLSHVAKMRPHRPH